MPDPEQPRPAQPSEPPQDEPGDIPVPTSDDWDKVRRRAIQPQEEPNKDQGDALEE